MEDFFLNNYFLLTHAVEILAALTGVFVFKKYRHTNIKYFVYFLVIITVCDILGGYTMFVSKGKFLECLIDTKFARNYWFSTLFWNLGAIFFFAYYYKTLLRNKLFKKILKYSTILFLVFSLTYIIIHWDAFFISYFPIISVLGAVIIFLCSSFYFYEILNDKNISYPYKSINFYISVAIFIWWLIITPIVFFDNYTFYVIDRFVIDSEYVSLRRYIYLFSNIFMYLTYTFAFIWCKPEKI
jgi:hypothetical protein